MQDNGEEMNVPAAKTVLLDDPARDTSAPLATVFSVPEKEEESEEANEEYKIVSYTKEEQELMMEMEKLMMERSTS